MYRIRNNLKNWKMSQFVSAFFVKNINEQTIDNL